MRTTSLLVVIAALVTLGGMACSGGHQVDLSATPTAIGIEGTPASTQPLETPTPAETSSGTPAAGTVDVKLTEWIVAPEPKAVAAGAITFNAENIGGNQHELFIIKTDLAPEALPVKDDGSFDEAGADAQVVARIAQLQRKGVGSVTAELEPGAYVLICNVVDQSGSHYKAGMRVAFQVTP
jgi:uncharacterized cupredoxin-like copper-binding protein